MYAKYFCLYGMIPPLCLRYLVVTNFLINLELIFLSLEEEDYCESCYFLILNILYI